MHLSGTVDTEEEDDLAWATPVAGRCAGRLSRCTRSKRGLAHEQLGGGAKAVANLAGEVSSAVEKLRERRERQWLELKRRNEDE